MSIFDFEDYRQFIKTSLDQLPHKGRGEISKIAKQLSVHPTLISLILSGERELTLDQAYDLAQYFHFTESELDYLLTLVQMSRAGSSKHKAFLKKKLTSMRAEANKISHRFEHDKSLDEKTRSIFYSSWLYSAIRLFTDTALQGRSPDEIAEKFQIRRQVVVEILDFLRRADLVTQEKQNYKLGLQRTFLEQGSPHLIKHHSNWRIKALQMADALSADELMFTSPMSLSKKDFARIREILAQELKTVSKIVKDSVAEDVACLNIDFFWVKK